MLLDKSRSSKSSIWTGFSETDGFSETVWVCVLLSGDVHCLAVRFLPWLLSVPALPWPVEVLFEAQKETGMEGFWMAGFKSAAT